MADRLAVLVEMAQAMYRERSFSVPFHGWPHVRFVADKTEIYAADLSADVPFSVAAAYLHDLNYLVAAENRVKNGTDIRAQILTECGYSTAERERIEAIIEQAATSSRTATIVPEAMALSDGDTAFKSLSLTPLMSALFLIETQSSLKELATGIVEEQGRLMEQGIYFYSTAARAEFGRASELNLAQWRMVKESLTDPQMAHLSAEFDAALRPFSESSERDRSKLTMTLSQVVSRDAH